MKHYIFALKPTMDAHQLVMNTLHKTGQDWKTEPFRKVQFANLGNAIVVRTNQEPTGIPCKPETRIFDDGQSLSVLVILPAQKRAREYRQTPPIRTKSEMIEYAQELLKTHGLAVQSIECKPAQTVGCKKDNRITCIAAMQVTASATITDAMAFAAAYDQGIGREKSLGFGMLLVKEF